MSAAGVALLGISDGCHSSDLKCYCVASIGRRFQSQRLCKGKICRARRKTRGCLDIAVNDCFHSWMHLLIILPSCKKASEARSDVVIFQSMNSMLGFSARSKRLAILQKSPSLQCSSSIRTLWSEVTFSISDDLDDVWVFVLFQHVQNRDFMWNFAYRFRMVFTTTKGAQSSPVDLADLVRCHSSASPSPRPPRWQLFL